MCKADTALVPRITTLYCSALLSSALPSSALHCITLHCSALHRTAPLGLALGSRVGVVTNMQRGVWAIGGTVHCIVCTVQLAMCSLQCAVSLFSV